MVFIICFIWGQSKSSSKPFVVVPSFKWRAAHGLCVHCPMPFNAREGWKRMHWWQRGRKFWWCVEIIWAQGLEHGMWKQGRSFSEYQPVHHLLMACSAWGTPSLLLLSFRLIAPMAGVPSSSGLSTRSLPHLLILFLSEYYSLWFCSSYALVSNLRCWTCIMFLNYHCLLDFHGFWFATVKFGTIFM